MRRTSGVTILMASVVGLVLALGACDGRREAATAPDFGGDPRRGRQLMRVHGCGACHTIPGVEGATAGVGPPLTAFGRRHYIAGSLPNTPDNLVRWLIDPPALRPGTAMPPVGLTEAEARDMASYLYAIDRSSE